MNDDHDELLASARLMSDDEIRVGLAEAAKRRDELVAAGEHWLAGQLQEVALVLAAVRGERHKLRLAVDEAASPYTVALTEWPGDDG